MTPVRLVGLKADGIGAVVAAKDLFSSVAIQ